MHTVGCPRPFDGFLGRGLPHGSPGLSAIGDHRERAAPTPPA